MDSLDAYSFPEALEDAVAFREEGWTVVGLDLGEVHVTTPAGQKFRLVCEAVPAGEDFF